MISKYSVKKPFTVVVAVVLVLILGFVSATKMSLDLIPSFNLPYAMISTTYVGASPEQVEMVVSAPLESSMASINNVKNISSVSSENFSMVILEFNEDANMDSAIIEMRESLDMMTSYLPDEVSSPIIMKLNPDMMPIVSMSATMDGMSTEEATSYINDKIIPEIESIAGIASVSATGLIENMVDVTLSEDKIKTFNKDMEKFFKDKAEKEIRKEMDKQVQEPLDKQFDTQKQALIAQGFTSTQADEALKSAKETAQKQVDEQIQAVVDEQLKEIEIPAIEITKDMVKGILQGQSFSMPAGSVASADGESYLVRVGDKVESVEELGNLTIMELDEDFSVTFNDIANITTYNNADTMYSKVNDNHAVVLSLQKQPDVTTADVSNRVTEKIAQLEKDHDGLELTVVMDQGEYVDIMIGSIVKNLIFGALFAVIILYIFLRKFRPTLIVATSILISVITAFVLMYFAGVTLNMISMGGLALGVGMLVDNSIVVIENIFRMRATGKSAKEAAIEGAKEVGGAITASTLTTVVVFLPIVFTTGMAKQLFTDMGLTIAFSLIASLVVALTLVPTASSVMLDKNFEPKKNFADKLSVKYSNALGKSLKHKWISIALAIVLLVGSVAAALSSGTEMFPSMDSGSITVSVEMPDEFTQEERFDSFDKLEKTLMSIDDVATVAIVDSTGGSGVMSMMMSQTSIYMLLEEEHEKTTNEVIQEIRDLTKDWDFEVSASNSNMDMSMLSGGQIVVNVYGNELDDLRQTALEVSELIAGVDGTIEIDNGLGKTEQELRVTVDKDKAIAQGLTVAQVFVKVNESLKAETSVLDITQESVDFSVFVKDDREKELTNDDIKDLTIENKDGEAIKISSIADFNMADGFSSISRTGQERYVSITGSIAEGYNVGQINEEITQKINDYDTKAGCRVVVSGESEVIAETFYELFLMILLAIVFIYLVMVAQFQSLLSPFIIMFTIPLAFTGGFMGLFIAGMPISTVSLIGLVILVGVVVNNGIVFVDYANQQVAKGMDVREALVYTGMHRLRPILMTALTTIIALVLMAFDTGNGAEMLQPMAVTTIGGLIYSTILTLFLVPAMYEITHRKKVKKAK